jgi:hypothetical protein
VSRLDHCFLLRTAEGERAMAFCNSAGRDREPARQEIATVLRREKGYESYDLAYLGMLDYREMEAPIEAMLEPFEKFDPVWLVYFRWGTPASTKAQAGHEVDW